ncbi:acyl-CoA reductase-like NAD-dependent aldehyde dehydrogenase [Pseudomonas lini]|nr:acyl-CoA reductase-like NAD-dependent aldehyde dehydrogenase [Pseudomonas lini]
MITQEMGKPITQARGEIEKCAQFASDRRSTHAAVTVTGSVRAGIAIVAHTGAAMKQCVLELGGSDPFIVLNDADLDEAVKAAVIGRYPDQLETGGVFINGYCASDPRVTFRGVKKSFWPRTVAFRGTRFLQCPDGVAGSELIVLQPGWLSQRHPMWEQLS